MAKSKNSIRIISGKFKGRKLPVIDIDGLRPTGDRVKELVFNSLQFHIAGRRILDLFAGSGSLGVEASSRGAKNVVMVEKNKIAFNQLNEIKNLLELSNVEIHHNDAFNFLNCDQRTFDLVFLDPPFHQGLLQKAFESVTNVVEIDGYIYCEMEKTQDLGNLPDNFELIKHKILGQVKINIFKRTR